jgi:hypothetical protein
VIEPVNGQCFQFDPRVSGALSTPRTHFGRVSNSVSWGFRRALV